jgi:hypothetical protein
MENRDANRDAKQQGGAGRATAAPLEGQSQQDVARSTPERVRELGEAYQRLAVTGREYVRASPGTAVLAALAAGFVLARLLGARRA